jgi:hypothetical protein
MDQGLTNLSKNEIIRRYQALQKITIPIQGAFLFIAQDAAKRSAEGTDDLFIKDVSRLSGKVFDQLPSTKTKVDYMMAAQMTTNELKELYKAAGIPDERFAEVLRERASRGI